MSKIGLKPLPSFQRRRLSDGPNVKLRLKLTPLGSLPKPNKPIWNKSIYYSKWPFIIVLSVLIFLALSAWSFASPPRSRGARPIALGNGYVASSGDGYSLFYNPAGLYDINQREVTMDYGRAYSPNESALSDFNGILVMPERIKDHLIPLTFGAYAEAPATGAHIVELSAGGAIDAPLDRWTRGILRLPARFGLTAMLRHQKGELKSDRVGSATISLGLTSGFLFPINKRHQVGFAIRNLFLGEGEPSGPSAHVGILRHHRDYLDAYAELEYAKGGIWRVHPGLEWLFSRGVLRPRLGWAHRESGKISHVSTGIGFYLSPLQIDMAYLVPVKTTNDNSGQFRASFVYRFGKPQFSEIYFDRALEAASQLDQRVLSLTVKEAETKSSLAETEQKRKLAREELENMKKRIQQLKDEDLLGQRDETIRQLKARVKQLEADLSENRSTISAMRQKKAEIRTHLVSPGDTLQSLAQQYYGDPNQWKKIFNANPDKIDRGLPKPGSKLVIP